MAGAKDARPQPPHEPDTLRGLRVGAVSYLNTRPLIYQLQQLAPGIELVLDVPSRLADALREGRLDVALIPSIESFQDPSYRIVSDACIGCRGPVLSVKLFSRVPFDQIATLALDEGSRTSASLTRILLAQRYQLRPRLSPLPLGHGLENCDTDAVLLIGDRAIHPPMSDYPLSWDLGEEWCRWCGLPFVFAMWTARRETPAGPLATALAAARDRGVAHLEQIAVEEAPRIGITPTECLTYLRDNLHFYLGPEERRALTRFHRLAAELDLAPPEAPITQAEAVWS